MHSTKRKAYFKGEVRKGKEMMMLGSALSTFEGHGSHFKIGKGS